MALANYYILFTDPIVVFEVILIVSAFLLGGAGAFIFFFYSMRHDRAQVIAKHIHNPWERMTPQDKSRTTRHSAFPKPIIVILAVIAALLVLILIALAVLFLIY